MAARMQQGGRPGGARFAQFKLVLLGKALTISSTWRDRQLTSRRRVCCRKEFTGPPIRKGMLKRPDSPQAMSELTPRTQDQFDDYRESTIGAAFLTQTIALDDQTTVKFEIWDTAGQERYKSLAPMYYRNANCAVVVYDITQAVSSIRFAAAKGYITDLRSRHL